MFASSNYILAFPFVCSSTLELGCYMFKFSFKGGSPIILYEIFLDISPLLEIASTRLYY
jgi:hypothetical protein